MTCNTIAPGSSGGSGVADVKGSSPSPSRTSCASGSSGEGSRAVSSLRTLAASPFADRRLGDLTACFRCGTSVTWPVLRTSVPDVGWHASNGTYSDVLTCTGSDGQSLFTLRSVAICCQPGIHARTAARRAANSDEGQKLTSIPYRSASPASESLGTTWCTMTSTSTSLSRSRSKLPPRELTVESSQSWRSVSDVRRFRLGRETSGSMSSRFSRLTDWLPERELCSVFRRLDERLRDFGGTRIVGVPGEGDPVPCSLFWVAKPLVDNGDVTTGVVRRLDFREFVVDGRTLALHPSSSGEADSGTELVAGLPASAQGSSSSPGLNPGVAFMTVGPSLRAECVEWWTIA